MSDPEVVYCDDYEAITGQQKPAVETKVVEAPATPEAEASAVQVETA